MKRQKFVINLPVFVEIDFFTYNREKLIQDNPSKIRNLRTKPNEEVNYKREFKNRCHGKCTKIYPKKSHEKSQPSFESHHHKYTSC